MTISIVGQRPVTTPSLPASISTPGHLVFVQTPIATPPLTPYNPTYTDQNPYTTDPVVVRNPTDPVAPPSTTTEEPPDTTTAPPTDTTTGNTGTGSTGNGTAISVTPVVAQSNLSQAIAALSGLLSGGSSGSGTSTGDTSTPDGTVALPVQTGTSDTSSTAAPSTTGRNVVIVAGFFVAAFVILRYGIKHGWFKKLEKKL